MFVTAACTPQELALYLHSTKEVRSVLSNAELARLRGCESTDNYRAVSSSGTYRGAYQFDRSTWNDVAGRHFPWLVGVDPAAADPWWQDAMARALWSERGRSPWPICGRRV
ncbi:MAG: transglycosylase family protein [Acidimicrobiales bacterium]